jgi:hypothetical protein
MIRPMHNVLDHHYPFDGKQFIACACPLTFDHPPADIVVPAEDEMVWVRWKATDAQGEGSVPDA